jgi:uncharacterized protein (TIGR03435 family)
MLAAVVLWQAIALHGQQPMSKDAVPKFDVVSVKPTPPGERNQGFQSRGSHIKLVRQTVGSMIMFAYGVHGKQIVNGPDWIRTESFDVDGVPDTAGEPSLPQFQALVKQLLAERFALKTHNSPHELSYYALRVAPGGPKLTKSPPPEEQAPDQIGNGGPSGQTMVFTHNSMSDFALGMQYFADRPVVDETSLDGRYDFKLQWMPDEMKVTENTSPGLFTAVREQLGLEMKPAKGPVNTIVVDHVEQPGEN